VHPSSVQPYSVQPVPPADPESAEMTQPLTPVRVPAPSGAGAGRGQSIGRASSMMAVANLTSRITGFLRQVLLATVLGFEVLQDSYTIANTLPNIIYELLIGGVLSSVLIPLLVRAQAEDEDGGEDYTRRLLTLTGVGLLAATALALVAASVLTPLYIDGGSQADPGLAVRLAYLLLPQIFFYGVGAILGAILNSRGAFGAFAWAPVLNNVVMLLVLGAYVLVPDPDTQLLVLGLGTTLGIVVQTLILIPAVRRSGFRYRPVWGWDPRLRAVGGRAGWTVLYVLAGQVGYVVLTRVATASDAGAVSIYNNAWLLLQVPYGVLGVSLLTALMPRMSRAAAAGRFDDVVSDLSLGSRMAAVLLIPVAAVFTAFGPEIGTALFGWRSANAAGAEMLGTTLAVSAFGLAPFAISLLQTRVFYAMTDSRTPFFVQLFTVAVKVVLMLLCPLLLPPEQVVLGLAVSNSLSFVAGAALGQVLLRRRLGRLPTGAILATAGRALVAAALGAAAARGVLALLDTDPMRALDPFGRAWTSMFLAVVLGGPLIVLVMRVLRVREVDPLLRRVDRIADRLRARRGPPR
jgi:putative peptidoglycan lipid II flippase